MRPSEIRGCSSEMLKRTGSTSGGENYRGKQETTGNKVPEGRKRGAAHVRERPLF